MPTPCLAKFHLNPVLDHMVLICDVRHDCVVIEDPVTGMGRVPLELARRMWIGPVIAVRSSAPVPPITPQQPTAGPFGPALAPTPGADPATPR